MTWPQRSMTTEPIVTVGQAAACNVVTNVLITCLEPGMTWPQRSMTTEPIVTVGQAAACNVVTNVLITCLEPSMTWPQRSMTTEPIVTVGQAAACNVADKHQQLLPALNSLCDWQPRTTCLHGNASRTRIALQ